MNWNLVFTTIASIVSVLISSGALILLFQIRATNNKLKAEAIKLQAETKSIDIKDDRDSFTAITQAANMLYTATSERMTTLSIRLKESEDKNIVISGEVADLRHELSVNRFTQEQLKRAVNITSHLLDNLFQILSNFCQLNSDKISDELREELGIDKLKNDLNQLESNYKEFTASFKDWTEPI